MARRKNKAFKYTGSARGKFNEYAASSASVRGESDLMRNLAKSSWKKYLSTEASVKLSLAMKDLALEHARQDSELDDIPDSWYDYKVERTSMGDYAGEALHHGPLTDGARYGWYDALIYEEVQWFDSRFEAESWAFTRAWLAFGSCDSFITGVRYCKRNRRFFAFSHEFE